MDDGTKMHVAQEGVLSDQKLVRMAEHWREEGKRILNILTLFYPPTGQQQIAESHVCGRAGKVNESRSAKRIGHPVPSSQALTDCESLNSGII